MPTCKECGEEIFFYTNDKGNRIPVHPSGACGYFPTEVRPRSKGEKRTLYNETLWNLRDEKPVLTSLPLPGECQKLLKILEKRNLEVLKQLVAIAEFPPADLDSVGQKSLRIVSEGLKAISWLHDEIKVLPTKKVYWDHLNRFPVRGRPYKK